jgi:hypothetical protein
MINIVSVLVLVKYFLVPGYRVNSGCLSQPSVVTTKSLLDLGSKLFMWWICMAIGLDIIHRPSSSFNHNVLSNWFCFRHQVWVTHLGLTWIWNFSPFFQWRKQFNVSETLCSKKRNAVDKVKNNSNFYCKTPPSEKFWLFLLLICTVLNYYLHILHVLLKFYELCTQSSCVICTVRMYYLHERHK